jgi:hypothetical protein
VCVAPNQDDLPPLEVGKGEAVIHGHVRKGDGALPGAYVRLLDRTGEFTAEVQSSATGYFRFHAAEGEWTLRVLAPGASVDEKVTAALGEAVEARVEVPA